MEGLVSLLDAPHEARVRAIWDTLEKTFGLTFLPRQTPIPHISYYVAERIDAGTIRPPLQTIAQQAAPFNVRATGLGLFTHPHPVLYVPVVRSVALTALHGLLRPAFAAAAVAPVPYYAADRWLPHITLAQGDLTDDNLPAVLRWFRHTPIDWEITINNVALIANAPHEFRPENAFFFNRA